MQNIIIVLVVLFALGGGVYFLIPGTTSLDVSDEAQKQANEFTNDLFNKDESTARTSAPQNSAPEVNQGTMPSTTNNDTQKIMKATLKTNQGDITIEFMDKDAPNTVANFVKLAKEGFYNSTKFHRVIKGFMIQGGDPQTKDDSLAARWGTGGPGYQFADEIHANNKNDIGTISMANAGPNTNGSQFFINVANNNFLDTKHTVFGRVVAGMEVVKKIEATQTGTQDRPVSPMVIQSVVLE